MSFGESGIVLKSNPTAGSDPTVNDDNTSGYAVGSWWFNAGHSTYWVCKDATTGAANWAQDLTGLGLSNQSAGNPGVGNDNTQGYQVGSFWLNTTSSTLFQCSDASTGAAVWKNVTGGGTSLQNNLTAVVNPTVNDDSGAGYSVGSMWFNISSLQGQGNFWICQDATVGAADWRVSNNAVMFNGAPTVNDDDTQGYFTNFLWFDLNANALYWCFSPATGAAIWLPAGIAQIQSDWTQTNSGQPDFIQSLYVPQTGSANGAGTLTALSNDVNWINISDGTNDIIALSGFNILQYDEITLAPIWAYMSLSVTNFPANNQISFAGDYTLLIHAGDSIVVNGSASNDGTYTIVSAAFGGGDTTVTISQTTLNVLAGSGSALFDAYVIVNVQSTIGGSHITLNNGQTIITLNGKNREFIKVRWDISQAQYVQCGNSNYATTAQGALADTALQPTFTGEVTFYSWTIIAANVAQVVIPVNKFRDHLYFKNVNGIGNMMYIDFGNDPTITSIPVPDGGVFEMDVSTFIVPQSLRVLGTNTGDAFIAWET